MASVEIEAQVKRDENPAFECRRCHKTTDAQTEAKKEALYQAKKFAKDPEKIRVLAAGIFSVCLGNILHMVRETGQDVCSECGWDEIRASS